MLWGLLGGLPWLIRGTRRHINAISRKRKTPKIIAGQSRKDMGLKHFSKWVLVGAPAGKQQGGQLPKLGNKVVGKDTEVI